MATSCWSIMAHVPKTRINNPRAKNCGNISRTYLVTKAFHSLSHIHSIFLGITEVKSLKFRHYTPLFCVVRFVYTLLLPPPNKNRSDTIRGLLNCLFKPLSSSLFEKTSHYVKINRCVTYRKYPWILLNSIAPQGATLSKKSVPYKYYNRHARIRDILDIPKQ